MAGAESNLTKEQYDRWLTPRAALTALAPIWIDSTARSELYSRLQHGLQRSVADIFVTTMNGSERGRLQRYIIQPSLWKESHSSPGSHFWFAGSIELSETDYSRHYVHKLFGVRFDPDQIAQLLAAQKIGASGLPTSGNAAGSKRRGAKRKDWWDHLWIEMFRRIEAGTLAPKNQAELQEILEEYVSNVLGENYGDSTLKPMASNLFKFLKERQGKIQEK